MKEHDDDIIDEKWTEAMRDLARDYNQPPMIVPREAMWAAIEAGQRRGRPRTIIVLRRFAPLAAAAAIMLAVGIAVGRMTVSGPTTGPQTGTTTLANTTPAPTVPAVPDAYSVVATQQLVQVQALLTAFDSNSRDSAGNAKADAHLASWARDLLSNTRLLLNSPAGADPRRKALLEDL